MLPFQLPYVPPQYYGSRHKGKEVRYRHAHPDAVQAEVGWKQHQSGQQVEQLAGQRHEDAHFRLADALEEVAYHHLCTDQREYRHTDAHPVCRHVDQRIIRGKYRCHRMRKQLADHKAARGDAHPADNAQAQRTFHAVRLLCAEVVAHYSLIIFSRTLFY